MIKLFFGTSSTHTITPYFSNWAISLTRAFSRNCASEDLKVSNIVWCVSCGWQEPPCIYFRYLVSFEEAIPFKEHLEIRRPNWIKSRASWALIFSSSCAWDGDKSEVSAGGQGLSTTGNSLLNVSSFVRWVSRDTGGRPAFSNLSWIEIWTQPAPVVITGRDFGSFTAAKPETARAPYRCQKLMYSPLCEQVYHAGDSLGALYWWINIGSPKDWNCQRYCCISTVRVLISNGDFPLSAACDIQFLVKTTWETATPQILRGREDDRNDWTISITLLLNCLVTA